MQLPAISAGVSNFKNRTGFKSLNLRWPIHESCAGKETDPTSKKGSTNKTQVQPALPYLNSTSAICDMKPFFFFGHRHR